MDRLTQKIRNRAWKWFNNIRRPHPQPRRALPFDDTFSETGVKLVWQGAPPSSLQHPSLLSLPTIDSLSFFSPFVLSLHYGSVIGQRGDVVTAQGTIFTNVSPEIPRQENHHFLLERGNMPDPRYIDSSVAVLNCGPYRNYFHFTFEAIGRLRFYQQAEVKPEFYCVAYTMPFQYELLSLFGIKKQQIIPLKKPTHLIARELIVASLPGYNKVIEEVHLKDRSTYYFIRQTVLNKLANSAGRYTEAIYIQRRGKRRLDNEAEVLAALPRDRKWKIVRLEEYTVLEQAAIFYHARTVVAMHGAGLTNLVYAQARTRVVEIFSPTLLESVYFQMANLFDLDYQALVANTMKDDLLWIEPEKVRAVVN